MKRIGIWLDFYKISSIKREGISRFSFYLIEALIINHNLSFDIWFLPANKNIINDFFSPLKKNYPNNIFYKTTAQKSRLKAFIYGMSIIIKILFTNELIEWKAPFGLYLSYITDKQNKITKILDNYLIKYTLALLSKISYGFSFYLKKIFKQKTTIFLDDLAKTANMDADSEIFLIPIIGHKLSQGLLKKQILVLHDLVTFEFNSLFKKNKHNTKEINYNIQKYIEILIKKNSYFTTHSLHVKNNQILKYFPQIPKTSINCYFLPILQPNDQNEILSQKNFESKFNLTSPYLFYPTQIRPNKNISTLLKAFKIIQSKHKQLKLVFTATKLTQKEDIVFIKKNNLDKNIIFTKDLDDHELYSLYKYAELTIIPTLFEGGFPWQAMESLYMKTPVILSKIPATLERLKYHNYNFSEFLFNPLDEQEIATKTLQILNNKNSIIQKQSFLKEKLLEITWKNVSMKYYDLAKKLHKLI